MTSRPLALAVLLAAGMGCGDMLTGPSRRVALNQEFELRVGESAAVSDELLVIRFDGVSSDSRCPLGVLCIQEGEARVSLVKLKPHPMPGKAIAAGDYVATLEVTRP